MERVYNHDSMSAELMQTICQYWQAGKHCDAVIVLTSGQTIKFHKLVLLAASPQVLTRVAHTDEDGLFRMFLHGAFDYVVVRNCLKYLYEGTVTLTTANVDKILTIAELLNITSLAGHCNTFQNDGTADCDNATPIKAENEGVYKCTSEMSTASGKKCRLSNVTVTDEEDGNVKMSINDTVADALDGYSAMDEEVLDNRESNYNVNNCGGESMGDIRFTVKDEPAGNLDDDDGDNDDGDNEVDNDNNDDGDNDDGDIDDGDNDDDYNDADYKVKIEPGDSWTDEEKKVDGSTGTSPVKWKDKKSVDLTGNTAPVGGSCTSTIEETPTPDNGVRGEEYIANSVSKQLKIYLCSICGYKTTNRGNMSMHDSYKHKNLTFRCPHCDKLFKSKSYMKQHVRGVHKLEKLVCELCSKSYGTRQSLNRHKRVEHGGAKRFTCNYCEREFYIKSHFEGHMNTHQNTKPFMCKTCGKSFSYPQNMTRHEKTCTPKDVNAPNERHMCPDCGQMFRLATSLNDHILGKHGEKNKVCACGKEFSWRSSYERHIRKCVISVCNKDTTMSEVPVDDGGTISDSESQPDGAVCDLDDVDAVYEAEDQGSL